jgi:anti-sigma B factor antagonist
LPWCCRSVQQWNPFEERTADCRGHGACDDAAGVRVDADSRTAQLLAIDRRHIGPRVILTAVGEVDMSSAGDLRRAVEAACDDGASEIWLDLTPTTFIDCCGLRALLELRASLLADNRRLVLVSPVGAVRRLLVLTGTESAFDLHPAVLADRPCRRKPSGGPRGSSHLAS